MFEFDKIEAVLDNDIVRVQQSRKRFNSRPTTKDIRGLRILLSDFKIKNIAIPEFETLSEMQHFSKNLIIKKLA
jgi:hypothetical protein